MSTKYNSAKDVPTSILVARLKELSGVVASGRHDGDRFSSEFTMRAPAEVDRDADIVLSEAARRLENLDS